MGCPRSAVILRSRLSSANQDISNTHLARVALPVIRGKVFNQLSGKIIFLVHKNTIPRDKYVVKDYQGLMPAEHQVTLIHCPAF